jgi:hypothetical protein
MWVRLYDNGINDDFHFGLLGYVRKQFDNDYKISEKSAAPVLNREYRNSAILRNIDKH